MAKQDNTPLMIIGGIVAFILVIYFSFAYKTTAISINDKQFCGIIPPTDYAETMYQYGEFGSIRTIIAPVSDPCCKLGVGIDGFTILDARTGKQNIVKVTSSLLTGNIIAGSCELQVIPARALN